MFYPPEDDSFGTLCSWLNTEHSMAVHFSVSTITGVTYDIFCTKEDTVQSIREQLEEHHIEALTASTTSGELRRMYASLVHYSLLRKDCTPPLSRITLSSKTSRLHSTKTLHEKRAIPRKSKAR